MAYYAMYHVLLALLYHVGIKSENHTISIQLLEEIFYLDITNISKAKTERIDKQYYVDFEANELDAKKAISDAEEFISEITDFLEKINNQDIETYRERFKELLNNYVTTR